MSAELFLERYSLPRIARLITLSKGITDDSKVSHQSHHAMAAGNKSKKSAYPINNNSSSSGGGGGGSSNQQLPSTTNSHDTTCDTAAAASLSTTDANNNGELFLLYRHLKKYRVYHAINAKSGTNRKKGIKIPQDFTGEYCHCTNRAVIIISKFNMNGVLINSNYVASIHRFMM
jgi:hypothetical protein